MLPSSLAASSNVGVVLGRKALVMVLHLVMMMMVVVYCTCGCSSSLPLFNVVVNLILLVDNMNVIILLLMIMMVGLMVMVMRRLIIYKIPAAHTQMLSVGICSHARLSIAHEACWRVAKRINLASSRSRHIERVVI